jgi:hypothetical protein
MFKFYTTIGLHFKNILKVIYFLYILIIYLCEIVHMNLTINSK